MRNSNGTGPGMVRVATNMAMRTGVGAVAGVVGAVVTLTVDRGLELPFSVPLGNVRPLLPSLVGAVLTIAVFTLWMRTVVVGITASQLSPRVAAGYLDDDFQRRVAGWMVGVLAYLLTVLVRLPGGQGEAPALSVLIAGVLTIAAFVEVLMAMRHAVGSLSPPAVVRDLADHALDQLRRPKWPDDPRPRALVDGSLETARADGMGWVSSIDHDELLALMPEGATLVLHVDLGDFVAVGDRLLSLDPPVDEDLAMKLRGNLRLGRTRGSRGDLGYAIQQLVDVVDHASAFSTHDSSTAMEALVHLRAVLRELLARGTATGCLRGDGGRWIVSDAARSPAEHLRDVTERLRAGAGVDPVVARTVVRTLELLERTADEVGDEASAAVLAEERQRLAASTSDAGYHVARP